MAKISELLAAGPTFSFEFMPPRTPEREVELDRTLEELEPLRPSFVSITYGAGGSTRERTHSLVSRLLHKSSMTPMAHLTCAAHSRDELTGILTRYASDGLQNLLALRGDPPLDANAPLPEGDLKRAIELVVLAREIGDFCTAVAMHPEGHPAAPDTETDRRAQAEKLRAADFGITQFFFRSSDYFRLVDDLGRLGVHKPIVPGIMPPTNVAQLTKMAQLSGSDVPAEVADALHAVADRPEEVRRVGVEIATQLCRELLDGGAPGLHFYTMNKSTATREIHQNLGLAP
jgi:methylenetetrahydrofolate reductase (NADPH)